MKRPKQLLLYALFALSFIIVSIDFISCTNEDDIIPDITNPDVNFSETELISNKVTSPPTLDGQVDAMWDDATRLVTTTVVPQVDFDNFKGYVGDSYKVTMRSVYDNNNIYFLAEWPDNNLDFNRETWYFNEDTKEWKFESRYPSFDGNGTMVRGPFYEDKFAILWNVNNSVAGWDNATCYASCHSVSSESKVRHYTKAGEWIDMWHWKSVRTGPNDQIDDQFQDWMNSSGEDLNTLGGGNGRHSDSKDTGGYTCNSQKLMIGGVEKSVPKYIVPSRDYYYWITQTEIDNNTAKLITSVDEDGVLFYEGGSIDPNGNPEFQRNGITTGSKCIPSIYTAPFVGSRGDISARFEYTGSGWVLEMKRALKTGDTEDHDVDFSSLDDFSFGIGVFDNAAIAHSIKANLKLKFVK